MSGTTNRAGIPVFWRWPSSFVDIVPWRVAMSGTTNRTGVPVFWRWPSSFVDIVPWRVAMSGTTNWTGTAVLWRWPDIRMVVVVVVVVIMLVVAFILSLIIVGLRCVVPSGTTPGVAVCVTRGSRGLMLKVAGSFTILQQTCQHLKKAKGAQEALAIILRDGCLYFIVVLAFMITNAVMFGAPGTGGYSGALLQPALSISSLLCSRMFLNLRESIYRRKDAEALALEGCSDSPPQSSEGAGDESMSSSRLQAPNASTTWGTD
ncbi:hypothetical protein CALCODRAFT_515228 [Calocera cornea HHB12733]|uniref:Uncharacterized protein n=1 Tax=Calocera cornea HHB12733 TaxID=1353952 RepID=A0A165IIL7_9BASI|nr:hypothetical protein CALCODRAFT_515228 [Calocera cornea HHB12733]